MQTKRTLIIFVLVVSMIKFFAFGGPFPETEEQNMRNRLLKCKDVIDVVVKNPRSADEIKADVIVYLTNDRILKFSAVHYSMKNNSLRLYTIGNERPWKIYYDYCASRSTIKPGHHEDRLTGEFFTLKDIHYFFPKISSVPDVINNYDTLYEFVSKLNENPENCYTEYEFDSYNQMDLSDWEALDSDYAYYDKETQRYIKLFKMRPKEND